jgi:DNA-binding NarL/FixJ family response regulator
MKSTKKSKTRVLIVDDHVVVRDGLRQLIESDRDLTVCGEAASGEEAVQVATKSKPDLAIVDITLGGTDGIELIKNLKAILPTLRILVLSMHDETHYAERALRAGANGYVMKREARDQIMQAIRVILAGDIYVSERVNSTLLHQYFHGSDGKARSPISRLSDRELEVLTLLGKGLSSKDIGERLHLSPKTVDSHRTHMKEKLGLAGAPELIRFAFEWVTSQDLL